MTSRDLKKRVSAWASVMGLSDWKIDAKFAAKTQSEDTIAQVAWQPEWKEAEMLFVSSRKLAKTGRSIDHFIVHELLHLRLEGHKTLNEEYDAQYEAAINVLADLIISEYASKV